MQKTPAVYSTRLMRTAKEHGPALRVTGYHSGCAQVAASQPVFVPRPRTSPPSKTNFMDFGFGVAFRQFAAQTHSGRMLPMQGLDQHRNRAAKRQVPGKFKIHSAPLPRHTAKKSDSEPSGIGPRFLCFTEARAIWEMLVEMLT